MKIWIITDTHFGHMKLSEVFKVRPDGFTEVILENLKGLLQPGDSLIHLGDFCIGRDAEWMDRFVAVTPGVCRTLVRGNHDSKSDDWYLKNGFCFVCYSFKKKVNGKMIKFAHKPEPKEEGVDFQLHGHSHGNAHRDEEHCNFYDPSYHLEVALEKTGYYPLLLETIVNKKA